MQGAPSAAGPLFIVLNAASGRNDAGEVGQVITARLDEAGREHRLELISGGRSVAQVARQAVLQAQAAAGVVVAAGGDGTINAVAQAALGCGCAFGVLPQGTFNYFGRTHGIPEDIEGALSVLLEGKPQPVQAGLVTDRRSRRVFLVNASLGLYPQLLEDREAYKAQFGRSRLVAMVSGLVTLMREHRQLQLRIGLCAQDAVPAAGAPVGTERLLRTPTLFVGNSRLQLEQIGIAEAPLLDRGQLIAIALRPVGTLAMVGLLLRGAMGRLGDADQVLSLPLRRMTVEPSARYGTRRVKVATDGEVLWMQAPLVFSVVDEALWLIKSPVGAVAAASGPMAGHSAQP